MLYLGDSLEILKTLPDNSLDACVTDPPYFLTNSGGSGFMGKEWDSLSVANAFAESILRSLSPVWLMAGEGSAQGAASTRINSSAAGKNIHALYVQRNSIDQSPSLSLGTFSVQENVLTRDEVLALSSALYPSLTPVIESQPVNVLYVVPILFRETETINIVRDVALRLVTARICEDLKTLLTLMDEQKTNAQTEAMTGSGLDSKFISATSLDVKSVESIVAEKRYSATISSPIEYQKTIRWLTSLRFVRNAMAMFTDNPGNIQILSERFHYLWAKEVFRVLKPGAHLLAFAGTRTYHPLANAIQSAGFEIRDQVQWIYGSGFPKSLDVSKAIDKAAGAERTEFEIDKDFLRRNPGKKLDGIDRKKEYSGTEFKEGIEAAKRFAPATPSAKQWQGWGTALKPANEPICVARKPLEKGLTVAQNVEKWGCGAINVDAGRIASGTDHVANCARTFQSGIWAKSGEAKSQMTTQAHAQGRWPANVIFDEVAAEMLDGQSIAGGIHSAGKARNKVVTSDYEASSYDMSGSRQMNRFNDSTIGASRFFYVAKASKRERNAGLDKTDLIWENDAWEKPDLKLALTGMFQLAKGISADLLTDESLWSTDMYGHSISEQYPKGMTYTISTALKLITELKTWSASPSYSIRESIQDAIRMIEANGLSLAESVEFTKTWSVNTTSEKTASLLGAVSALLPTLLQIKGFARSGNFHSTVKPIRLMEYLIKLITPPGGTVLDPFMGSGSTGVAAKRLGFHFTGIELSPEYFEIAKRRIEHKQEKAQLELEGA